ncbi:MAG TPA: alkaline phosphatase family protein [Actinomycetota bacterium]|nr:alkaline phosphatase family protein [Actinomycetota bacterium]
MSRGGRLLRTVVVLAVLVAGGFGAAAALRGDPDQPEGPGGLPPPDERTFETDDPVERACALDKPLLARVWRGYHPKHSEDVTFVPLEPNYSGAFDVTSHSGPWDYLQNVPLVFYGPGVIAPEGRVRGPATLADVFPTVGAMAGVPLPEREGRVLHDALGETESAPRLVVTIMWDGVGRNVLERWPGRWPNLARMEREGTSYLTATVGSSPSITPATHSTLGAGVYPRTHGVTAINIRTKNGDVRTAFNQRDPGDLKQTTFADEIDLALGNEPLVGMLAWKSWHIGMMGHGTQTPGGDADQLAIIGGDERITGNPLYDSAPEYLENFGGLEEHADELDLEDGEADGKWRGHGILELHDNPAWVEWETDAILAMLENEGYGDDEVTDFFFTNYKPTDIVGHQYTMDSPEMGDVLEAQDAALGRLLDWLDANVSDYAVILSSDHGHTPSPERSGAWPLLQGQLQEDIDAAFDVPKGKSLVEQANPVGPFLDKEVMNELGVTGAEVAEFLNGYRIRDNWGGGELPEGFEDRGDENVIAAAWSRRQYGEVMRCAFGSEKPPASAGLRAEPEAASAGPATDTE